MAPNMYSVLQSRVWAEQTDKETLTRLLWYERAQQGDLMGDSMRFEMFKRKLERNAIKPLVVRTLPPIDRSKNCVKSLKTFQGEVDKGVVNRANRLLEDCKVTEKADMYPVDQTVKKKLYDGFTKENKGRYQYMKERKQQGPEAKYPYPLCSSWDYGWKLDDHIPKESIRHPVHGRRSIVQSDFYTRNQLPQYHSNRYLVPDDARAYILMAD